MPVISCHLPLSKGDQLVYVRELNGNDEIMIDATGTPGLIALLQRLLYVPGRQQTDIQAESIVIAERDYLLSLIYQQHYGSKIQSTLLCGYCGEKFDLDFLLPEWVSHVRENRLNSTPDNEGYFLTSDQQRFRLPNGVDELTAQGLPLEAMAGAMLSRCVPDEVTPETAQVIQNQMDQIAPPLSGNIETHCPECRRPQPVHFDIQTYFMARMKQEKKRVTAEIHCIAMTYKWAHSEILALPRSLRKRYAALIGFD